VEDWPYNCLIVGVEIVNLLLLKKYWDAVPFSQQFFNLPLFFFGLREDSWPSNPLSFNTSEIPLVQSVNELVNGVIENAFAVPNMPCASLIFLELERYEHGDYEDSITRSYLYLLVYPHEVFCTQGVYVFLTR
jgi:hypothetical protein